MGTIFLVYIQNLDLDDYGGSRFGRPINNEPILSSMLAAGIVQDTFAGEAGEGERGRQSGDDWRLLLPPGPEILSVS